MCRDLSLRSVTSPCVPQSVPVLHNPCAMTCPCATSYPCALQPVPVLQDLSLCSTTCPCAPRPVLCATTSPCAPQPTPAAARAGFTPAPCRWLGGRGSRHHRSPFHPQRGMTSRGSPPCSPLLPTLAEQLQVSDLLAHLELQDLLQDLLALRLVSDAHALQLLPVEPQQRPTCKHGAAQHHAPGGGGAHAHTRVWWEQGKG